MATDAAVRLLIADLDGTLVESWRETPLPGITERLARLQADGVTIVAVTNQGGVGYRYAHERRGEIEQAARYPTLAGVITRLETIASALPISRVYSCLHHGREGWPLPDDWPDDRIEQRGNIVLTWRGDWRKPAPGMLLRAVEDAGAELADALMIGDRPEDQAAAVAAGTAFRWADEWRNATGVAGAALAPL